MFQNFSCSKEFMHNRGLLQIFVSSYGKTPWGKTSVFQETSGIEKLFG